MSLVGERRALSAAVLGFFTFVYGIIWLLGPPPELSAYLGAITLVYGLGFFGLVAGYFWARWFAIGLGIYGLVSGVFGVVQMGAEPIVLFLGGTHAFVAVSLWGSRMAAHFDGRTDWRARFHLDENATNRLGKAVIRIGFSLPIVVAYSLAPRPGMDAGLLGVAGLAAAAFGLWGLLRMRTWGVLSLAAGGAVVLASCGSIEPALTAACGLALPISIAGSGAGALGGLVLLWAAAPFAGPMARFARRGSM